MWAPGHNITGSCRSTSAVLHPSFKRILRCEVWGQGDPILGMLLVSTSKRQGGMLAHCGTAQWIACLCIGMRSCVFHYHVM